MTLGVNQLHPLEIEDARDSAFRASELQREVEDRLRDTSRTWADAEREYRKLLSTRIVRLRSDGYAVTSCETIAKGHEDVADLRHARDIAKGAFLAVRQEAYRRGADRADTHQLIEWSMKRDLRTDTPPADWSQQSVIGGRRAA